MDDLKGRSVRGGGITFAAQIVRLVLQMGSTAVLARLLTPGDFGLVAMVTGITGFVAMFKDAGLSMATVQRAEITHEQISTLFWINVALSVLLMFVVAALAPVIAWFYAEPQLIGITVALAGTLLFSGLTVQHQALLRRQMRFRALALIDIGSMGIGVATAVVMALFGLGYWSLVGLTAGTVITNGVCVWVASKWRPGRPVRGSGVRVMLAFGGNLTGFSVINYCARNIDSVLIGRVWGIGPLGLYSKAYSLMILPIRHINAPLAGIAIPSLSRLQNDPARYRQYYEKAVLVIGYATLPMVAVSFVLADELVLMVLGPNWAGAVTPFRLLTVGACIQPLVNTVGWVYVSLDQTNRMLKAGATASVIIIIALFVGLHWGINGVAAGWSVAVVLSAPALLWYAYRQSPVRLGSVTKVLTRPMLVAAAAGAGALAGRLITLSAPLWATLASAGLVAIFCAALCIAVTPPIRRECWDLIRIVVQATGSGRASRAVDP